MKFLVASALVGLLAIAGATAPARSAPANDGTVAPTGCSGGSGTIAGIAFNTTPAQSPFAVAGVGSACTGAIPFPNLTQGAQPSFSFAGDAGATSLTACGGYNVLTELSNLVFGTGSSGSPVQTAAIGASTLNSAAAPPTPGASIGESPVPAQTPSGAAAAPAQTRASSTTTQPGPQAAPTPDIFQSP